MTESICPNDCSNGVVACWSPGGPCDRPNEPGCETCGTCNNCTPARVTLTDDEIALAHFHGEDGERDYTEADVESILAARETAIRAQIQALHDHADEIADQRNVALAELAALRAQIKADLLAERDKWKAVVPVPEGWDLDYILRRDGRYSGLDIAARIAGGEQA